MKALFLTKIGADEDLVLRSIDVPRPGRNEALIKVKYCGLNHLDLLIKNGKRPGPKSFPHILGSEIVGVIDSVNSDDTNFKNGDHVVVYPWTFCGKCKQCLSGNENICDYGGTLGRTNWGGYVQYIVVPLRNIIKISKNLPLDRACAATLVGATACHLIERAKIRQKSTVLVTGATGGVGVIVIQLLKNMKCRIIAVTSHKNKINLLQKLGVDNFVLNDKFKEQVKKIHPNGVDYVIDIIGGAVWSDCIELLSKNGTLVYCATTLGGLGIVNIGNSFSRQVNILGSYGGRLEDLNKSLILLKKGILSPVIDSIYPMSKANLALKKLENQKVFGKILLKA